jgi:hypothetical protein
MAASSGDLVPNQSREHVTWRRVPWTCAWGRFDNRALRGPSGERCFWQCLRGATFNAGRPLQKGDCDTCPYWERRRTAMSNDT